MTPEGDDHAVRFGWTVVLHYAPILRVERHVGEGVEVTEVILAEALALGDGLFQEVTRIVFWPAVFREGDARIEPAPEQGKARPPSARRC